MSILTTRNLNKYYGKLHVLRSLDLDLEPGEGTVLLGSNGCGKSTLMRCLNGLEPIQSGQITLEGKDVSRARGGSLRAIRKRVGMVFQQYNLVDNLTVFQNVLYGAMGHYRGGILQVWNSVAPGVERERAMESLDRVGLADKALERCSNLSGGQQQRVAIARMLMQRAKIILADEPVASLDPKAGREVMDLLWDVVREHRLTVLCTLHQLELAEEYADRIVGMKAGRIVLDTARLDTGQPQLLDLYRGTTRVDATPSDKPEPEMKPVREAVQ